MSEMQSFRSALGGFNREDGVRYIEYINNKHSAELAQLNTQLQTTREALSQAKAQGTGINELKQQLEDAQARCAELETVQARCTELEAQLAAAQTAQPAAPVVQEKTFDELEAYRRAERAERLARDRAAQIYAQANAALADATVKVEAASEAMTAMADQLTAQAQDAKNRLRDAVSALYAIRPEEE